MRNNKIIIGLTFGLIVLSMFVIGNSCHDVAIDEGYGVNGIKIRYNSADITDEPAYLLIGNKYELKTKGKNLGNYDESVYFEISIVDSLGSIIESWHHTYSLNIDQSKYVPSGWEDWDTSGLAPGIYTIIANASISAEECDYSNNERKRAVILDYDDDNDSIVNILDKCQNSRLGEEVDENGCDAFQFCEPFYCSLGCFYADWKGNEGENPNDCAMVIVLREGEHYPECVPLSCGD